MGECARVVVAMARIGVQFEKPPSAVQAVLDRFVFGLIRKKAQAKRPLGAGDDRQDERRLAPRVELGAAEEVVATVLPPQRSVFAPKVPTAAVASYKLLDLSTTGCAFGCPDPPPFKPGEKVRLRLKSKEIDVEIGGKIVHVHTLVD
jgi:hypothetical protein